MQENPMYNLIGNTCIPAWITTKCLQQQLINPFSWCIMDFDSCYNLVKYFDVLNFGKYELKCDNKQNFSIIINDLVEIQYVHYHVDASADIPKKRMIDIYYNRIWEFILDKYVSRCKRMIHFGIPPIFIFACANSRKLTSHNGINLNFTLAQQKALYDLNSPYKIITSYKTLYNHENAVPQTESFSDNGLSISTYLFNHCFHDTGHLK